MRTKKTKTTRTKRAQNALPKFTVQNIIDHGPCHDPVEEYGVKPSMRLDALAILRSRRVVPTDKIWVVTRPGFLPDCVLRVFAADVAEAALVAERKAGREPDDACWNAVAAGRLYAEGLIDNGARSAAESAARSAAESAAESAARSAARNAARNAARSAAWNAARSAARNAAWSAAESAARSAAESAAESAARSAARSAAYKDQVQLLTKLLRAWVAGKL